MKLQTILLILLTVAIANKKIIACTCTLNNIASEIRHSKFILSGKILSKEVITVIDSSYLEMFPDAPRYAIIKQQFVKYILSVNEVYKGRITKKEIEVYSGVGGGGDCGYRFKIGKEFIIYGSKETYFGFIDNDIPYPKGKNIIWTNICTRTQNLNQNELDQIQKVLPKKMGRNKRR